MNSRTEVARLDEEQKGSLNPFGQQVGRQQGNAMVEVESSRAVAETQAAIMLAKRFPRDPVVAVDRILQAFTRPTLAEKAEYAYARGGTDITGPSIRAAETIAQLWGNIQFGIRELTQANGASEVEAFAWDVETNTRQVKVFRVPHSRYTRAGGNQALTDPRDIYEMVANQGARRLRACILGIIPGDVIEAAMNQADTTLKTKADVTPERLKSLLEKFAEFGVTQEMIEKRIQRRLDAMTPALLVQLGKVYNALRDGIAKVADHFDPPETGAQQEAPRTLKERAGVQKPAETTSPAAQGPDGGAAPTPEAPGQPQGVASAPEAVQKGPAPAIPAADVLAMAKKAKNRDQGDIVLDALNDPGYTEEEREAVRVILKSKSYNE